MTARLPTFRDLRLGSGLVLFVYVATHLANHALGLASVALAERGLDVALAVWHSLPGTVLLYGAAATHVTLALVALYRRRTLRMPPLEVLRIALGLGIPLLLIGHAVHTRVAWEAYRLAPEYARVVWSLWTSDGEGRQLALLVPGWLHGCLGVNFAFGRRPLYQRLRPALFAAALLLPVLGGLGFLAMGKELAGDEANRAFLDANADVDVATRIALLRTRDTLLAVWFALIGAVFVAREVRAFVERRRNAVITIAYPQRVARVPAGWTVLEASRSHFIPHLSMCGGQARCSTCRVQVTSGDEHCPPPGPSEQATLDRIRALPGVRLACQLRPTGDVGVVPLLAATGAAAPEHVVSVLERDLAVVVVAWRNRLAFARGHLPQDVVYLSGLFGATVGGAVHASGGTVSETSVDSVVAVFGVATDAADACRQALAAAEAVDRALDGLRRRYASEFGAPADFAVFVHAGPGAVSDAASPVAGRLLAAGDAFDTLQALRTAGATGDASVVVTTRVLAQAGRTPPAAAWRDVALPDAAAPLRVAAFADGAALRATAPA
ncbi:MAG: 2Fe-2S iron-sulfur cluster-binding protein [Burkholderiales bacterium]